MERSSTLRVSQVEIWLTVYRSIYIIRMQGSIDWYWGLRFFVVGHVKMLCWTNNVVLNIESVSFKM